MSWQRAYFPPQGISSPQGAAVSPLLETASCQGFLAIRLATVLWFGGFNSYPMSYMPCTGSPIKTHHLIGSQSTSFQNCISCENIPSQNSWLGWGGAGCWWWFGLVFCLVDWLVYLFGGGFLCCAQRNQQRHCASPNQQVRFWVCSFLNVSPW